MKVTTKGQVTIPAPIRRHLGITPHADVDFRIRDDQVVLVKRQPQATMRYRQVLGNARHFEGRPRHRRVAGPDTGNLMPILVDTNVILD